VRSSPDHRHFFDPGGQLKLPLAALLLAALLACPSAGTAQPLTERPARVEDVSSIDGIIAAFYDIISHPAGIAVDWARDSTLYRAELRFRQVDRAASGAVRLRSMDHGTYAASQSAATGFLEREIHRVTHRFGPIAQVWSTYEWRTSEHGPVGGRGINAVELYYDGTRWWITSAMWTGETESNPIPRQYLPAGG
jgi:hypothetical protein